MNGHKARGFTLVEVVVALTIAAIAVLSAQRIFVGIADGSRALSASRVSLDRSANAHRWLKAAFLSLEPPFEGRVHAAAFTSWQMTPGGWFEPRPIELRHDGTQFVAHGGDATLTLGDGVTALAFDYLLEPGADTRWVREWISPVSAPLAVRLRITGCGRRDAACVDTLLFLIKERG